MSSILLKINHISKSFKEKKRVIQALDDVSFEIKKGETLGLLGPNGAGKTTLSNILATLNPPTAGEILMDDVSIYKNLISYRKMLGYCSQHPSLNPNITLRQNLEFDGFFYGLSSKQVAENLERVVEQFTLGNYLDSTSRVLSGGFLRRFALGRTLMHNPQFVILDEPTVGLDPHIRRQVWKCIELLKEQGITIILTTHYLDEAELLSDRICFLDQGRVKFIDTPDNIKKNHDKGSLEEVFVKLYEEE